MRLTPLARLFFLTALLLFLNVKMLPCGCKAKEIRQTRCIAALDFLLFDVWVEFAERSRTPGEARFYRELCWSPLVPFSLPVSMNSGYWSGELDGVNQ